MKIALTSSSFAGALRRAELTHLEWLEVCASRLDVDGVVFALADFPRTDREYTAQVKKAATDLGLVCVALDVPGLLDPARPDDERAAATNLATALGCVLLRVTAGPPGDLPPETFARMVASTKAFASLAKTANITIAAGADPATLLDDLSAIQHFTKYVDSAWLRYDVALNDPERGTLGARDRVVIERLGFDEPPSALATGERRPWLVLEGDGGADPLARAGAALDAVREVLGQRPRMPSVIPG